MKNKPDINEDIGSWLSGYIDGELTQQQRQRVEIHCEQHPESKKQLEDLIALRKDVAGARLSQYGDDTWRENMQDTGVNVSKGIGWVLLLASAIGLAGMALHGFISDSSIGLFERLITFGIYGGLGFLFVSVLRQRLIERKTDKYKDVEI